MKLCENVLECLVWPYSRSFEYIVIKAKQEDKYEKTYKQEQTLCNKGTPSEILYFTLKGVQFQPQYSLLGGLSWNLLLRGRKYRWR